MDPQTLARLRQMQQFGAPPDIMGGIMGDDMDMGEQPMMQDPYRHPSNIAGGPQEQPNIPAPPPPEVYNPPPVIQQPQPQDGGLDTVAKETLRLKQLYEPEHEAIDMYSDTLRHQPQMNRPSIASRIAASGAAIQGGPDAADRFMHAPYMRDMAAWKETIQPQYNAANLERQSNQSRLTLAREIMRDEQAREKLESQEKIATEKNAIERLKAEGWTFNARDGEYVTAYQPSTGETKTTNLKTIHLSEMEKLNIEGRNRIANTQAQGVNQMNVSRQQGANQLAVAGVNAGASNYRADRGKEATLGAAEIRGPSEFSGGRSNPRDAGILRGTAFQNVYDNDQTAQKWISPATTANSTWQFADAPDPSDYYLNTPGMRAREKTRYDNDVADFNRVRGLVEAELKRITPQPRVAPQQPQQRLHTPPPESPQPQQTPQQTPLAPPYQMTPKEITAPGGVNLAPDMRAPVLGGTASQGLGPTPDSAVLGGRGSQVPPEVKQQQAADIEAGRKLVVTDTRSGVKKVIENNPQAIRQAISDGYEVGYEASRRAR